MQKDQQERIEKRLKASPAVGGLCRIAREHDSKVFLGGGALRDLLLGSSERSDLDFYLQCDEDRFTSISEQIQSQPEILRLVQSGAIDLHRAHNVPQYVQQFDFTINTLVYDVEERRIISSDAAARDIASRQLRVTSVPLFATSFRSFVRGFRLAQSRNLQLDPGYIEAVREFGGVLSLCDSAMHTTVIGELFHLFALSNLSLVWPGLEQSRLLVHLFPFLIGLERQSGNRNSLSKNFEALRALDSILMKLPKQTLARLTTLHEVAHFFGSRLYIAKLSEIAVVRLSVLFANMGQAWVALDSTLQAPFNTPQFAANAAKTFLLESKRSLEAHPAVEQAFSMAADISQRAQFCCQQIWTKTAEHLENLSDSHLQRLLCLHLLALQSGGQKISAGDPDQAAVERFLRSKLTV